MLKFVKRLVRNWHIKLFSLALAAILWIYVDNLKAKEMFLSIPLEVRNVPSRHIVSNELPMSVKVVLKGKEGRLALVNENSLRAHVDLEGRERERSRSIVRVDKESLPSGVTVKEISPASIETEIEAVKRKRVKIVPVIYEEPPVGYQLEDVVVDPEAVEIEGPVSLVDRIDSVYTEDIDASELTETTVKSVEITLESDKISLVDDGPVSVKAVVKELYVVKRVEEIPIVPVNLQDGLRALLLGSSVSALIKIPKRLERSMTREKVVAIVECEGIDGPGVYDLPVIVEAKLEDASFINFEPRLVEITVEKEQVPRINY